MNSGLPDTVPALEVERLVDEALGFVLAREDALAAEREAIIGRQERQRALVELGLSWPAVARLCAEEMERRRWAPERRRQSGLAYGGVRRAIERPLPPLA